MNHNPDILDRLHHAQPLARGPYRSLVNDSITEIERLSVAGNGLERELMKLHRNHHGPDCDTCQALIGWWEANGR